MAQEQILERGRGTRERAHVKLGEVLHDAIDRTGIHGEMRAGAVDAYVVHARQFTESGDGVSGFD